MKATSLDVQSVMYRTLERVNVVRAAHGARPITRLPMGCFIGTHHPVAQALSQFCSSLRVYPAEHRLPWRKGSWNCLTAVRLPVRSPEAEFLVRLDGLPATEYCVRKCVTEAPDWLDEFVTMFTRGYMPNLIADCFRHWPAHQNLLDRLAAGRL